MTPASSLAQALGYRPKPMPGRVSGGHSLGPHLPGHCGKPNPKLPLARRDRGRVTTGLQGNLGQPRSLTPPALGSQSLPSLS